VTEVSFSTTKQTKKNYNKKTPKNKNLNH